MILRFLVCINECMVELFSEKGDTRREAGWGGGKDSSSLLNGG